MVEEGGCKLCFIKCNHESVMIDLTTSNKSTVTRFLISFTDMIVRQPTKCYSGYDFVFDLMLLINFNIYIRNKPNVFLLADGRGAQTQEEKSGMSGAGSPQPTHSPTAAAAPHTHTHQQNNNIVPSFQCIFF